MTFKKTVGSLSFVLAATVSSIALAQGLGAGVNANVGIGSAPVSANVQAGAQTTLDAPAAGNPNASLDSRSETTVGSGTQGAAGAASAALGGTTQALEASGKTAVGTGRDTAAAAQAQAHDAPLKAAKSRKIEHARKSTGAKTDLEAGAQLKAKTN